MGAALLDRETIGEGHARLYAIEADSEHAVHLGWYEQRVPENRGDFPQSVHDAKRRLFTFFQANHGARYGPVDRDGRRAPAANVKQLLANGQIDGVYAQRRLFRPGGEPRHLAGRGHWF